MAERLRFPPSGGLSEAQNDLAEVVGTALKLGRTVFAEVGCGIGKTKALLQAAIRSNQPKACIREVRNSLDTRCVEAVPLYSRMHACKNAQYLAEAKQLPDMEDQAARLGELCGLACSFYSPPLSAIMAEDVPDDVQASQHCQWRCSQLRAKRSGGCDGGGGANLAARTPKTVKLLVCTHAYLDKIYASKRWKAVIVDEAHAFMELEGNMPPLQGVAFVSGTLLRVGKELYSFPRTIARTFFTYEEECRYEFDVYVDGNAHRDSSADELAALVVKYAKRVVPLTRDDFGIELPKSCLVFSPSYEKANALRDALNKYEDAVAIAEQKGACAVTMREYRSHVRRARAGEFVFCVAPAGGSLAEGTNLECDGVFVAGLPYPAGFGPDQRGEDRLAVIVRQILGRTKRSESASGVAILLDRRWLSKADLLKIDSGNWQSSEDFEFDVAAAVDSSAGGSAGAVAGSVVAST
eukprot:g19633.t1